MNETQNDESSAGRHPISAKRLTANQRNVHPVGMPIHERRNQRGASVAGLLNRINYNGRF